MQKELDADHAFFALERWANEVICLNVHAPLSLPPDPKSCEEAVSGPEGTKWVAAMDKELKSLTDHGTMVDAEEQEGPAMKTKWVLKNNYTADYDVKCKARLVVCGYSQRRLIDYGETFAPTTSCAVTNLISQTCASNGWPMATFDVSTAFLEGEADRVMYARLPKFTDPAQRRVRIVGNWYGLKQGPKIWNDQLNSILLKLEFIRCPVHPCLYKRDRMGIKIVLGVHVDDGLMGCNKIAEFKIFIDEFNQHVQAVNIS
eukprot:gene47276-biopygen5902